MYSRVDNSRSVTDNLVARWRSGETVHPVVIEGWVLHDTIVIFLIIFK